MWLMAIFSIFRDKRLLRVSSLILKLRSHSSHLLTWSVVLIVLIFGGGAIISTPALGQIHQAPVIINAYSHYMFSGFPLESYRLIKNSGGKARIIPFQIDEKNMYEDFVLEHHLTKEEKKIAARGNGVFDYHDELSFMGADAGSTEVPQKWDFERPDYLFRVDAKADQKQTQAAGAVFVGIYLDPTKSPPLSDKRYVQLRLNSSSIKTSLYDYSFDPTNYLAIKDVSLNTKSGQKKKIVESSSFYLKADLKYFLTLNVGHRDIISELKAYKTGPIRTLVKISFLYKFLRLNFEMGMYTEVSFFANMVTLPTIMHNPLEGRKNLNKGSGFYYGFGLPYDMSILGLETNMPAYKKTGTRSFLPGSSRAVASLYQISLGDENFLMNINIKPSEQMKKNGQGLNYYMERGDPKAILARDWKKPKPLGEAPVNLGVYLELSNFSEGQHVIDFNLLFDNDTSEAAKTSLKGLPNWVYTSKRIPKDQWAVMPGDDAQSGRKKAGAVDANIIAPSQRPATKS